MHRQNVLSLSRSLSLSLSLSFSPSLTHTLADARISGQKGVFHEYWNEDLENVMKYK